MNNFKVIILCIGLLISISLVSCNDVLNQLPKTSITEPNFYKTEQQMVLATNAIYRQLAFVYSGGGLVDLGAELRSDNTRIIHGSTGAVAVGRRNISRFQVESSNPALYNAWKGGYKAIYICNNVISKLKKTQVTFSAPDLKKRLIAEAKTIRALIYFDMVRDWGSVPMPLKLLSVEESFKMGRTDKDAIYKQVINDLEESMKNLPVKYSGENVGRITKYAAAAILAKVYFRIGKEQKAKGLLKQIIDSGVYSLDANNDGKVNKFDYKYLYQPDTKNSQSSIVEIQFKSGANAFNSNLQNYVTPWHQLFHLRGVEKTTRGAGMDTPAKDLINSFERSNGIRRKISAALGFYTLSNHEFIKYPYTRKFYDPNYHHAGQNFEIIRYADILLMYAEITHDPFYLNKVRARVGLPGYGEPGYPGSKYNTLEEAIWHERRLAFCFEFHRFYDLTARGRALKVMKSKGYPITKHELIFPIPQNVIDVNPNIKQNSGY